MDTVRFRLRIFALLFILVLLAGVVGFMFLEDLSPSDALYFSIVTITTVGSTGSRKAACCGRH